MLVIFFGQMWKLLTWIAVKKVTGNYQLKQLKFKNYFIKSVLQNHVESTCSQWRTEKFKKTLHTLCIGFNMRWNLRRAETTRIIVIVKWFFFPKKKEKANGQCFCSSLLIQYLQETRKRWCWNDWNIWILKSNVPEYWSHLGAACKTGGKYL